jgi:hypothetical protein
MTPKVSPAQQHILERLSTGWQVGVNMTLDSRNWLQDGGAGCGGATERVSGDDVHALVTQRLVYQSKQSFPTSTYDITESGRAFLKGEWTDAIHQKVAAILNEKGVPLKVEPEEPELPPAKHPSYGNVSISHISGGHDQLYGASVRHDHKLCLRIEHSEIVRNTGTERYHAGANIVEVDMSYDQFVNMLFNSNRGGTPCTIRSIQGETIESPTITSKRGIISKQFAEKIKAATDGAETLRAEASRILKTPGVLKAADKSYLLGIMDHLVQDIRSNIPYVETTFQEALDKSVGEVETQLAVRASALGVSGAPKLLAP